MPSDLEKLAEAIRLVGSETGPIRPTLEAANKAGRDLGSTLPPSDRSAAAIAAALQQASDSASAAASALGAFDQRAEAFANRLARGHSRSASTSSGVSGVSSSDLRDEETFEAVFPELSDKAINPQYPSPDFTQNCQACVVATDLTLAGRPQQAISRPVDERGIVRPHPWYDRWPDNVRTATGGEALSDHQTIDEITGLMTSSPEGSRGIVHGIRFRWDAENKVFVSVPGHVFNVVKRRGRVYYVDGQTGKYASLAGYSRFQFMRTSKGK